MAISESDARAATARLLNSRMRILTLYPFYGLLLMHMRYGLDLECETAYTDGERIMFSPDFLDDLSDRELDFVMMHEILHVALAHVVRGNGLDDEIFNIAADIVVNSNILKSCSMKREAITLREYGESMHLVPGGKEGYDYTAEEVYDMLIKSGAAKPKGADTSDGKDGCGNGNGKDGNGNGKGKSGNSGSAKNGKKSARGGANSLQDGIVDDHGKWKHEEDGSAEELADVWRNRVINAAEVVSISEQGTGRGTLPIGAQRLVGEITKPRANWRQVLAEFVQEEINDYSFSPPDRRFPDSDFFLPDFNDGDSEVKDLLFFIDTSGSMSDGAITAAYSEIAGAIQQFGGKLNGWLGFFDSNLYPPVPFASVEDVLKIRPKGCGGTDFNLPFEYLRKIKRERPDNPPTAIIIMTDGYCPYPPESAAEGTPTLWAMTTAEIPPWGKHTRIAP